MQYRKSNLTAHSSNSADSSNDSSHKSLHPMVGPSRNKTSAPWCCSSLRFFLIRKMPFLGRLLEKFKSLHPVVQVLVLLAVLVWKILMPILLLKMLLHRNNIWFLSTPIDQVIKASENMPTTPLTQDPSTVRILYIMTSLAEYNSGHRATTRGDDRLVKFMLPTLVDSVTSMVSEPYNYEVDVCLVLGYHLKPERKKLIETSLPEGVGLYVWEDAIPLGYDREKDNVMKPVTRGLARQHRYVIKDNIDYYDLFVAFEDDMRITGEHIKHYLYMSKELDKLVDEAPHHLTDVPESTDPPHQKFYGEMTKAQLERLIPGLIRVEVLLNEDMYPSQEILDPIPVDWKFPTPGSENEFEERHIDAQVCCGVKDSTGRLPPNPTSNQVVLWETAILGAVVRQLPHGNDNSLNWILLQPGPKNLDADIFIGGYWSGLGGAFGNEPKPSAGMPNLIAQHGGMMATRDQLIKTHENYCPAGFFPPYNEPLFKEDGLIMKNVEFWSGGYQFYSGTVAGCNRQRVISLNPNHFSKHLIYHTSNNKQMQMEQSRVVKAANFWGQLNSVVKAAKTAMRKNL